MDLRVAVACEHDQAGPDQTDPSRNLDGHVRLAPEGDHEHRRDEHSKEKLGWREVSDHDRPTAVGADCRRRLTAPYSHRIAAIKTATIESCRRSRCTRLRSKSGGPEGSEFRTCDQCSRVNRSPGFKWTSVSTSLVGAIRLSMH